MSHKFQVLSRATLNLHHVHQFAPNISLVLSKIFPESRAMLCYSVGLKMKSFSVSDVICKLPNS